MLKISRKCNQSDRTVSTRARSVPPTWIESLEVLDGLASLSCCQAFPFRLFRGLACIFISAHESESTHAWNLDLQDGVCFQWT